MMTVAGQLAAFLDAHPTAWVGAFGPDVLYVPLPPTVRLGHGHRRLSGRWVLDHIAASERGPLSDVWRAKGDVEHLEVPTTLVTGGRATLHAFMDTEAYGANILVIV